MAIKKLFIKNIKSHKNTTLEFSPGVNIIIGDTDAGKSAIIQSLGWLFFNRPVGDKIRSKWGGDSVVTVHFEDGIVKRRKTNTSNQYFLIKNQKKQKFEAVRSTIPEEIVDFVNINGINYQAQLDKHFLLSSTSGEVSKFFNKIANLDSINTSLANIKSDQRETDNKIKYNKDRYETTLQQIKSFINIKSIEEDLNLLQLLDNRLQRSISAVRLIKKYIFELKEVEAEIQKEETLLKIEKPVDEFIEMKDKIRRKYMSYKNISSLVKEHDKIDIGLQEYANIMSAEKDVVSILSTFDILKTKDAEYEQLYEYIREYTIIEKERISLQRKAVLIEKEFHRKIGKICPLCGERIKK